MSEAQRPKEAGSKVPALQLERLALGELPEGERAAILARLGDRGEAELAALRASNAEILAEHPAGRVAAEVRRRAALRRAPARRAVWYGLPAVAAAAVVIVVLWPEGQVAIPVDPVGEASGGPVFVPGEPGETRIKGLVPRLVLHRQVGDEAEPLQEPAQAGPQDVLQVSYVAAGAAHGAIASLDGRGVVTLHFPADPSGSTALAQQGAVRLAQAYELDDAPAFERFVFVTAAAPLDPARVQEALRALAGAPDAATRPLALPEGWREHSFLVRKVPR